MINNKNPTKSKKSKFLYHPNNPNKSFNVYIDKNPSDTIPIKYTTINDVKNTILKLEKLYKNGKYPHKRIWQVGMILKVRLEAMNKYKKTKYPNAKNVFSRFKLAEKYFKFLGKRTKEKNEQLRKKMIFIININKKTNKKLKGNSMNNIPFNQFKSKREYLLHKCGLPDINETSHCFNDETHHTCCELSKNAREYADKSGNPIGKLSEEVFNQLPDNHPKKKYFLKNNKRPWCTCFGSKVCGYYSDTIDKNTNISFISSPNKNKFANSIDTSEGCEEHVRNKFNVMSHGTPGINNTNKNNNCKNKDKIRYRNF